MPAVQPRILRKRAMPMATILAVRSSGGLITAKSPIVGRRSALLAAMSMTRRGVLGGMLGGGLAAGAASFLPQSSRAAPPTGDSSAFEAALRAKFAAGDVLN